MILIRFINLRQIQHTLLSKLLKKIHTEGFSIEKISLYNIKNRLGLQCQSLNSIRIG